MGAVGGGSDATARSERGPDRTHRRYPPSSNCFSSSSDRMYDRRHLWNDWGLPNVSVVFRAGLVVGLMCGRNRSERQEDYDERKEAEVID